MNFDRLKRYGLLSLAISLPVSHVPVQFAVAFLFALMIYRKFFLGVNVFNGHLVPKIIAAYVAWNMLSAALSPRPLHSLWATIDNEWPSLTALVLLALVEQSDELWYLLRAFVSSASVAAVYAIVTAWTGYDVVKGKPLDPIGEHFFRATGFYGFYLTYAAHAMTAFFLAAGGLLEGGREDRKLFGVSAALLIVAIVLTFARSIWLGMIALIPLALFLTMGRRGWKIFLPTVLGCVLMVVFVPTIRDRALSTFDPSQNETRLHLWSTAVAIAKDHPVLGIGEDNWDYYFEKYKVPGFYDTTVHAHNDYLTALVNGGIPALIAFIFVWVLVVRAGVETWRASKSAGVRAASLGAVFGIAGMLIGSMFQNYYGTFINCFGLWFLAGLVLAAEKIELGAGQSRM